MRILVTGSRDWPYAQVVYDELSRIAQEHGNITVVEGACPTGSDQFAHVWVKDQQFSGSDTVGERHPADWAKHGKAAGPLRNQEMVDLGADLCLVFCLNSSRGTLDCARRAQAAGIRVRWIELRIVEP